MNPSFAITVLALAAYLLVPPGVARAQTERAAEPAHNKMTPAEREIEKRIEEVWSRFLQAAKSGKTSEILRYVDPTSPTVALLMTVNQSSLQEVARNHKQFGLKRIYLPYAEGIAQQRAPDGADVLHSVTFVLKGDRWLIAVI
jgi:hypothetical protein